MLSVENLVSITVQRILFWGTLGNHPQIPQSLGTGNIPVLLGILGNIGDKMSQSFEEFRGQIPQNSSNIGLGKGTGLKGNLALLIPSEFLCH